MPLVLASRRCLQWVTLLVALLPGLGAAEPIPTGADCYTDARLFADTQSIWKAETDHYRKITKDPPDLVEKGVEFVMASQRSQDLGGVASLERLAKLGEELTKRKAADPLVRYTHAKNLSATKLVEAYTIGKPAAQELIKAGYPVYARLNICNSMLTLCVGVAKPEEAAEWQAEYDRTLVEFVKTASTPIEQRLLSKTICEIYSYLPLDREADLREACEKLERKNTWALDQMAGEYERNVAWTHRGTGWANSVTPEKYKLFVIHLKAANERLTAAWRAKPEFPYAAAAMIGVALAGEVDSTPRLWLDRALAAQMDYGRAYSTMLYALRPRWGGTYEQMLALADECAATKRYDTTVPLVYDETVRAIMEDSDEGKDILLRDGIYEKLREVYEGCAADPAHDDDEFFQSSKSVLRSKLANYAMNARRNEEARRILEELGPKAVPGAFSGDAMYLQYVSDYLYAILGEQAEVPTKAYAALGAPGRRFPEQRAEIVLLLKQGESGTSDERGKRWFQYWLRILQDEQNFDDGKWVDLSFDRTRMNWRILSSHWKNWKPDGDRGLTVNSTDDHFEFMLLDAPLFTGPLEVEVTVDYLCYSPPWAPRYQVVGLIADHTRSPFNFLLSYVCGHPQATTTAHAAVWAPEFNLTDQKRQHRLKVQVWEKQFAYYLDGDLALMGEDEKLTAHGVIGLSMSNCWSNAVKFHDMRVRKLTDRRPSPSDSHDAMVAYFRELVHLDNPEPRYRLVTDAGELYDKNRPHEAIQLIEQAISEGVTGPHMDWFLGECYRADRQYINAEEQYLKALKTKADYADALASLGALQATCPDNAVRNGKEAKAHATRACELTDYKRWTALNALAMASAENGDFDAAKRWASKAIDLAENKEKAAIRRQLVQYEKKQAFRTEPENPRVSAAKK